MQMRNEICFKKKKIANVIINLFYLILIILKNAISFFLEHYNDTTAHDEHMPTNSVGKLRCVKCKNGTHNKPFFSLLCSNKMLIY